MTTPVAQSSAMDELWGAVLDTVRGMGSEQWDAPVPWCPGWRVADLVSHLAGLQGAFNGDPQPRTPADWSPPPGTSPLDEVVDGMAAARLDWPAEQRLEELQRAAKGHVTGLAAIPDWSAEVMGPLGPTTHAGLYRVRAFDIWVHLQDLREALGKPVDLHDTSDAAAAAYDHVLRIVPWLYAKRVEATEGSTLRMQLGAPLHHDDVLAMVDGRARWDPDADPDASLVTATPAALTLLTSGRGTPERWRDAGALTWAGAGGEDFVARARMF